MAATRLRRARRGTRPPGAGVGCGTGWNAALIAHRVGPAGHLTSVEAAPELAAGVRAALARAGLDKAVTVVVGDGAQGHRDSAAYDRVIATYAVDPRPLDVGRAAAPGWRSGFPLGPVGAFRRDRRR
ncbi:methyltransferase domain-containing protein [Embleya sp. NPDC005971]|uniref:protein-L-isoaspartate O-methyltransferase family protein n=1 Tax=Embleya sp. NPDC005971 TaxID=3156724 RepID=UPI0033DB5ECF